MGSFYLLGVVVFILGNFATAAPSPADSAAAAAVTCSSGFTATTAQAYVTAMDPGWNLGNTLDAIPNEGDWGNPAAQPATFDDIKAAGFKSIRIPVTYVDHFTTSSPTWTVDPAWLSRVSTVVGYGTSRGLRVIVNVHHDSWNWFDLTASGANYTAIEERFYRLWYQIGTTLACTNELVSFEPINEPPSSTDASAAELNKLNNIFLQAIKDAGGYNAQRVVTLVGPTMDSAKTIQYFQPPNSSFTNPWAIQFHYYSPYDYVFLAWGRSIWGSDADKSALDTDFANIRNAFPNVPMVIGEWGSSIAVSESAARWRYIDVLVRTAKKYNMATVLWDNGGDFFDRSARTWREPAVKDLIINAQKGTPNALADSTVDGAATNQSSSAYIFHKVGATSVDQTLTFALNGTSITNVVLGTTSLTKNTDYTLSGSTVTFKAAFLTKSGLNVNDAVGVKGTVTISFSQGAALPIQLVQWNVPTLSSTSSKALSNTQVNIPVAWKGIAKLAAVKAVTTDGVYLFDDWTVYLGPLQQARITYNGQYNWDSSNAIITSTSVNQVLALGKATVFTFEFFPRVAGNAVNYTLTV
ncbi:glycoside hydrolase superfamily [Flagelloscypha sp. PMI_526]|nr:glycoside hydrolase superfamily [Flagelloscypha sp. PMI_526]